LALAFGLAGCTGETPGQVVLALQTDMSMPEDVTKVKISVKADGVTRYDRVFIVDPTTEDPDKIPATLSVVAGEKENETIEIKVVALRDDEPRTLNKTITTMPTDRVAMLRVPMQWLCTDNDGDFITDFGDGDYESGCDEKNGKETACVAGACEDVHLNSSKLPDFAEDAVFGGSDDPGSGGTCFPTEACFDAGHTVMPDENCVLSFEPESDDIINFAVLAADGGICRGGLCYVALDQSRDFGWYELDDGAGPPGAGGASGEGGAGSDAEPPMKAPAARRFQLPQGVCNRISDGRAYGVRVSTDDACEVTKTPRYPTCGPWSSVGKDVVPPEPPPTDGDGDGFETTDVGGDDCDDTDDTVNPEGVEMCGDYADSNCNGDPDDCITADDADGDGVNNPGAGGTDCDDNDNSVYPGALEACDEVDNDCNEQVDDNCVADLPFSHRVDFSILDGFTSTADYAIYQAFDETRTLDLDQKTLVFVPDRTFTRYTVTTIDLAWDDDLGVLVPDQVSSCDDCFTHVPIEFSFNFYGREYTTVFPSSNGYLTFGVGDSTYTENVQDFLAGKPRISAFWDDLDTRGTPGTIDDEVYWYADANKLVVTYQNIQIYSNSGTSNTFQFVLEADGTIKISYDGMDDLDQTSLVGITPGSLTEIECTEPLTGCFGTCVDLETSAAHCGACGNLCESAFCSAGSCAGDVLCQQSGAVPCSGLCVGTCQLSAGNVCDGSCYGTCDGTCDTEDTPGHCNGACDGDCTGTCTLPASGGNCAELCSGACYVDAPADCADPTDNLAGSCVFTGAQLTDASNCSDTATVATTGTVSLRCSSTSCRCTRSVSAGSVYFDIATTADTACESVDTLRETFLGECMARGQCGAGCPATEPAPRAACDENAITTCYYPDPAAATRVCTCMGGSFVCQ
jgi:hypothetical protein